jgi:RecA/RadA recombinase
MPPGPTRPRHSGGRQLALAIPPPESVAPEPDASPRTIRSSERLNALLQDLGSQVQRGGQRLLETPALLPCGLPGIDALLEGGFPGGRISEIVGPASSGRTSLAMALLAHTTREGGELVAVVDHADAFDPLSAVAAGVDLDRILWARVSAPLEAQRCTSRLLETEGIPLILLDLRASHALGHRAAASRSAQNVWGSTAWLRLSRLAASTRTALVVLSSQRSVGPQAEVVIEMQPAQARFRDTPMLLESVEFEASLVRHRAGPEARSVRFAIPTPRELE